MTQSKLEVHLQILKAVALLNSINADKIAFYTQTAAEITKQSITFLLSHGLIEHYHEDSYRIARRGMAVLRYFGLLEEQPPVLENC